MHSAERDKFRTERETLGDIADSFSSSVQARHIQPTRLLWRLHSLVDQCLFASGICAASLPLVYYIFCYYYQGIEKGTCRERNSNLTIVLGGTFLLTFLVKCFLQSLMAR